MKTTKNQLIFESIEDGQKLLDKQDPGYKVAVALSGLAVIVNEKNNVVMKILPTEV
jgi:hypothetical protein